MMHHLTVSDGFSLPRLRAPPPVSRAPHSMISSTPRHAPDRLVEVAGYQNPFERPSGDINVAGALARSETPQGGAGNGGASDGEAINDLLRRSAH